MSCSKKLVNDIINDCAARPVKGVQPLAYWGYRKDFTFTTTANVISVVNTYALGVIESTKYGLNAGHELVSYEDKPDGFKHKFSGIIHRANADMDVLDDIIVFVRTMAGVWLAYGVEQGLWKASQARMTNDNLGTVAFEFTSREGMEEIYSEYVVTADLSAIPNTSDYEIITGLTIGAGNVTPQAVILQVDSDKTCYVVLPDGTIRTSVTGVINGDWNGVAGAVVLIMPKDTTVVSIAESDFIGVLITNNQGQVSVNENILITGVNAQNALSIYASLCAITAANADLIFLNADANGKEYGAIEVSSQTPTVEYGDLSVDAQTAIQNLIAKGWTILIDDLPA